MVMELEVHLLKLTCANGQNLKIEVKGEEFAKGTFQRTSITWCFDMKPRQAKDSGNHTMLISSNYKGRIGSSRKGRARSALLV
jgi:hypothetical protein